MRPILWLILLTIFPQIAYGTSSSTQQSKPPILGYSVQGNKLYDPCGEELILRGINEMFVYLPASQRVPLVAEIAKTGANALRIVWNMKVKDSASLAAILDAALAAQMVPIPELHDATGRWNKLPELIDYWLSPEMLPLLLRYQDRILINVGSEVGDHTVTKEQWEQDWSLAIQRLRAAGITAPLIIDAPKWGQDIDRLQESGPVLSAADPLHNILLSVHMWWPDGQAETIARELAESVRLGLPLLVGEFGPYAVYQCPAYPFDYHSLLTLADSYEIGWLAWSWGGIKNRDCPGLFDMTSDGRMESLQGWGWEVVIGHPKSIQKTAKRSRFLTTGSCQARPTSDQEQSTQQPWNANRAR